MHVNLYNALLSYLPPTLPSTRLKDTKIFIPLAVGVFPSAIPEPWASLTHSRGARRSQGRASHSPTLLSTSLKSSCQFTNRLCSLSAYRVTHLPHGKPTSIYTIE